MIQSFLYTDTYIFVLQVVNNKYAEINKFRRCKNAIWGGWGTRIFLEKVDILWRFIRTYSLQTAYLPVKNYVKSSVCSEIATYMHTSI